MTIRVGSEGILPRVVFLSSPPYGERMLSYLKGLPCEVVFSRTQNEPTTWEGLSSKQSQYLQSDNYVPSDYDLGISFLYSWKVHSSQFEQNKYRWINFHPAPLPEYRGRNVAYHAIMNEASSFGATVHYMDKDYDTGEIIRVERFPILPWHTAGDLMNKSKELLCEMFTWIVPKLLEGKMPSFPQEKGTYYKKTPIQEQIVLTPTEEKRLRAITYHPKHHAFVVVGGKKYKIIPEEN
jgi:methionyl-tRNA formyltransferase